MEVLKECWTPYTEEEMVDNLINNAKKYKAIISVSSNHIGAGLYSFQIKYSPQYVSYEGKKLCKSL